MDNRTRTYEKMNNTQVDVKIAANELGQVVGDSALLLSVGLFIMGLLLLLTSIWLGAIILVFSIIALIKTLILRFEAKGRMQVYNMIKNKGE